MSHRCASSSDIAEQRAKIADYEAKAKQFKAEGREDIWSDDAQRYRRELNETLRERKLWLAAKAEMKGKLKAKKKAAKP